MRILHLPSTFFPRYTGGKEVFVHQLIKNMSGATHHVLIHDQVPADYYYDDIPVKVLAQPYTANRRKSYYTLLYDAVPGFDEFLNEYQPEIVHFHDYTAGASLSHLRLCKQAGIKTLITYHSPGSSCLQKGLTFAGQRPCNGIINDFQCTSCRYQSKGIAAPFASLLALISHPNLDTSGKFILRNTTIQFRRSWTEFFQGIDGIQVSSLWLKKLLGFNGLPSERIHYIDLGGHPSLAKSQWRDARTKGPMKLVFSGRCTNIKGAHVLIDAIMQLPIDAPLEIHFLGPYWDDTDYGRGLKEKVKDDHRFKPPMMLKPSSVLEAMKDMDIAVIPSLWPETGPLTVLDAFAAGVPVVGTNLAGIAERIEHGKNGLLFQWGDSKDLAEKLKFLISNRQTIGEMKQFIRENKTFERAALEMQELYLAILNAEPEIPVKLVQ